MKTPLYGPEEEKFAYFCAYGFGQLNIGHFIPGSIIYHYTNLDGLTGIVNDRSIWASNFDYLNDLHESSLIGNLVRDGLNDLKDISAVNGLEFKTRDKYVTSFSRVSDDLNQWRSYGSDGFGISIGFDSSKLLNHLKKPGIDFRFNMNLDVPSFQCHEVIYESEELVSMLLRYGESMFAGLRLPKDALKVEIAHLWFGHALGLYESIAKSSDFKPEEEVRLIGSYENLYFNQLSEYQDFKFINSTKDSGSHNLMFRTSDKKLIPYYEVDINCESIVSIVIGPKHRNQESEIRRAIRLLFMSQGVKQPSITISKVPYN